MDEQTKNAIVKFLTELKEELVLKLEVERKKQRIKEAFKKTFGFEPSDVFFTEGRAIATSTISIYTLPYDDPLAKLCREIVSLFVHYFNRITTLHFQVEELTIKEDDRDWDLDVMGDERIVLSKVKDNIAYRVEIYYQQVEDC